MAKTNFFKVRITDEEMRMAKELVKDYNLSSISELIRSSLGHLRTARPELVIEDGNTKTVIEPGGKA